MTDGGYKKDEAGKLQPYTGRIKCEGADKYTGKTSPRCWPVCEACILKWMDSV